MRPSLRPSAAALVGVAMLLAPSAWAETCKDPAKALGVSRIIEIDAANGPLFGSVTKRDKEEGFLADGEVVLTFDDGPVPWVTTPILDALDEFCTKATFFSVGEMALAYPAVVKDVIARGHTVGTHTFTHPSSLRRLPLDKAKDEIERGFAAVSLAAGVGIAPFFRFPGLADSNELLAYLQSRNIASFSVDVISNDSYIGSAKRIADRALKQLEKRKSGILLFHDLKKPTAKAIPGILAALKAGGYKVVHLRAKTPVTTLATLDAELQPILAKTPAASLVPFYGPVPVPKTVDGQDPTVTELAPDAKPRVTEEPPGSEKRASSQPLKRRARLSSTHRRRGRRPLTAS